MNIHLVTIAYGLAEDTANLLRAATSREHDVFWHIFLHSRDKHVMQVCFDFTRTHHACALYSYGTNRGVAKSWNEGVLNAYAAGADVVIVSNDDIVPSDGDVTRLAEAAWAMQDCYLVTCEGDDRGLERQGSMRCGFFAWNKIALDTLGMMDENFFPMYFEDTDYHYRAHLAGLKSGHCSDTAVVHLGSKSVHSVPGLANQNEITFALNECYYQHKWGGSPNRELFTTPFDDGRFGWRIRPEMRAAPYPAYNRDDFYVVQM